MGVWQIVHSILAVVGGGAFVVVGVACVWPIARPRRPGPARGPARARCSLRPVVWPEAWTCNRPGQSFTLSDAHRAMQLHRDHDCPRKRAAFAALIAAGRITPDSARRHRLWGWPEESD
ncbi:hypothetical protein [Nocardia sputorum]|uniref:Uncharacterized protein n=1 Tax=Nocardia sputorum TaxID=2984338 RepID=A0ABN6UC28_9NOCA|nr:hypothetical protein [Nocardia sputorum]BDU02790.1 hypothetical protein IFM12276_58180 [Nocardia sputorum]